MNSIEHQPSIVETSGPGVAPPLAVLGQAQVDCRHEDDTRALCARLARSDALSNATVTLQGDLGAGKTTFVRHLLRALGVSGRIKSPTYAVVEPHEAPPAAAWPDGLAVSHFDFYRFSDPREWEDAGFRELFAAAGLKLVEWPDKARGCLPMPDLNLDIMAMDDDQRHITVTAHTLAGLRLLEALHA